MTREPWFARQFDAQPASRMPALLERLRGTPARLDAWLRDLPAASLTRHAEGAWSAQENLGHLLDLEPLWRRRAEQLFAGEAELAPTDLANRRTFEAGHNTRPIEALVSEFGAARCALVDLLRTADETTLARTALHPRLRTPMTLTDLAYFVAEHDDHHVATMAALLGSPCPPGDSAVARHAGWVRASHGILAVAVLTLALSGYFILMVHPRLYWGAAGNDLMPALLELPISRNFQHGGWTPATPFFGEAAGAVTASRTYDIFNQNGWARSLHFLAAWWLVVPGLIYLLSGLAAGHLRAHVLPRMRDLSGGRLWHDLANHFRLRVVPAVSGPRYGPLQKLAYTWVIVVAAPLMVVTGLAMSPAVTASWPMLGRLFGGYQSARTVHFALFVTLLAFTAVHLGMVILTGFVRQVKNITIGD